MSAPHKPEVHGHDSHGGGEPLSADKVAAVNAGLSKIEMRAHMSHNASEALRVITQVQNVRSYLATLMNSPNPKKVFDHAKHHEMLHAFDEGMGFVAKHSIAPPLALPASAPPLTPAERTKEREQAQKNTEQIQKDLQEIQKGRDQAMQLNITLEEHHAPHKVTTWKESILHGEGATLAFWGWPSKILYKKIWRGDGGHKNFLTWPSKIIRNGLNMTVLGKGHAWNPLTWPSKTAQYMATAIPEHKYAAAGGAVLLALSPLGVPLGVIVGGVAAPSIVKFFSGKKDDAHADAHGHDDHAHDEHH
jgi:hypothetical protein